MGAGGSTRLGVTVGGSGGRGGGASLPPPGATPVEGGERCRVPPGPPWWGVGRGWGEVAPPPGGRWRRPGGGVGGAGGACRVPPGPPWWRVGRGGACHLGHPGGRVADVCPGGVGATWATLFGGYRRVAEVALRVATPPSAEGGARWGAPRGAPPPRGKTGRWRVALGGPATPQVAPATSKRAISAACGNTRGSGCNRAATQLRLRLDLRCRHSLPRCSPSPSCCRI